MQTAETLNPDQISQFLKLGDTIEFAGQSRAERYAFAQQLLVAQEYSRQGKKQRGAIRAYLSKMTGLSLPQTARLIQSTSQPEPSSCEGTGATSASTPTAMYACWQRWTAPTSD
jgi:hypothetical protein